jgi:hypothetical protein
MIRARRRFQGSSRSRSSCCAVFFFLALLASLPASAAATEDSSPAAAPASTLSPTITFTLDFPESIPDHYRVTVNADGHAAYDSTGKLTAEGETPEPFHMEFMMSAGNRTKIFELARRARYFAGKLDSDKHNLANTGTKTLTYQDEQHSTRASYNYSSSQPVQELTSLFQGISMTLEFGRRLEYFHRYQKLALDDELKRMDEMERSNALEEVQAVGPILKKISEDQSVINGARARALRLLQESR